MVCSHWVGMCGVLTLGGHVWCAHTGWPCMVCSHWVGMCGVLTLGGHVWCAHTGCIAVQ